MGFRFARAGFSLNHFVGLAVVSGACCWSVQARAGDSSQSALSAPPDQPVEQPQSEQAEDTEHSPVRFGFLAQARADIVDDTVDGRTTYHPEAWLHRVRPTLRVATRNEDFVSFVQINVLPDALYLVDLWADVRLSDWLQLRAGQLKVPFTRYRSMSVGRLTLVNWPITAAAFGAEWQMGVMLHNGGGPSSKPAADIDYAVGVFMGAARTSAFATGVADSHGRAVPNHSDLTDPATGVLSQRDPRRRAFTGALRAFLVARDRTCRNAWCGAPVRHIDHITRHADGTARPAVRRRPPPARAGPGPSHGAPPAGPW